MPRLRNFVISKKNKNIYFPVFNVVDYHLIFPSSIIEEGGGGGTVMKDKYKILF